MNIIVLGSTGMLGRYVSSYLSFIHQVICVNREDLDAETITVTKLKKIFKQIVNDDNYDDYVIINCMGTIKPRVDELGEKTAIYVNSLFPYKLAELKKQYGVNIIHVTTDCVFSGKIGNYVETSPHDAHDVYGKTKSLGECKDLTIIRTSIIGEEINSKRSLIEWAKSNKNNTVNGYINHLWNGITCLQFAKLCELIINKNMYWKGVKHIYSPNYVTKDNLLQMISDVYNLNLYINKVSPLEGCDRTLSSQYPITFTIPGIYEQILEQQKFYSNLSQETQRTNYDGSLRL